MKYEPIVAGNYYHIYNRGNNREDIFIEERNYEYFLDLMKKHLLEVLEIIAYCLLKNHFHLVIRTKENVEDKSISQKLSNFFNAYSKAINKSYERSGSLFQDRFARKQIESEDYLISLIIYVHNNPVHHGFTNNFENYTYSSYQEILTNDSTYIIKDFVLGLFDDEQNFKELHRLNSELKNHELILE